MNNLTPRTTSQITPFIGSVATLVLLAAAGCGVESPTDVLADQSSLVTTSEASINTVATSAATPNNDDGEATSSTLEKLIVAPYQQSCEGYWVGMCYLVKNNNAEDWRYLYEDIQGFEFESGYQYEISVAVVDKTPDAGEAVPADYYLTEYHFVAEIAKAPADSLL